jgi:hypothetical protein
LSLWLRATSALSAAEFRLRRYDLGQS